MKYDFDTLIDRHGTKSLKYDFAKERGRDEDILPLWVADMDFRTVPEVSKRLADAALYGIYGYSEAKEDYFEAIRSCGMKNILTGIRRRNGLSKRPALSLRSQRRYRAFTKPGEGVLIQQPVYYPFSEAIKDNGRVPVNSPLKLEHGHYEVDFEDFEQKIKEQKVRLFLLCSPHNPVGRVWKEEELRRMGDICLAHGVKIVSDEIHGDFTYPGHHQTVFASLGEAYAKNSVICTAPSKTFNLAGLQVSNIFIPDPELRRQFKKAVDAAGYSQLNLMGLIGCQAAYETGEEWLSQLKEYLAENLNFVRTYLQENIPQIHLIEPEGTYLLWLDFRTLGLTEAQRVDLIEKKAHLWVDSGAMFGVDGEGFERINIACPRATLKQALDQLRDAVNAQTGRQTA